MLDRQARIYSVSIGILTGEGGYSKTMGSVEYDESMFELMVLSCVYASLQFAFDRNHVIFEFHIDLRISGCICLIDEQ